MKDITTQDFEALKSRALHRIVAIDFATCFEGARLLRKRKVAAKKNNDRVARFIELMKASKRDAELD